MAITRRERPSKLDPHVDLIGTLPDKEVAERAGVTAENVRTWRVRRGIPARWRGETEGKAAKKVKKKAGSKRATTGLSSPRRSKLDPFVDKLGVLTDREVAELAGVSAENVRSYRKRRGIPASWRGEGPTAKASRPAPAANRTEADPAPPEPKPAVAERPGPRPTVAAPASDKPAAQPTIGSASAAAPDPAAAPPRTRPRRVLPSVGERGLAYRLSLVDGQERTEFVVIASDLARAAELGTEAARRRGTSVRAVALELLGEAL